jgi:tight adherence protein B
VAAALEPLRRAGAEGYLPTGAERRRLAALVAGCLLLVALAFAGPAPAVPLAAAGPAAAAWGVSARRRRYRRAVERGLADTATAVADALAAGRSVRAALGSAAGSLEGPPAVEMARVGADLELGESTTAALAGLRTRLRSPRVDALCAALAAHQLAGGDLVGLLRRFATAAAEREGVVAEARSATAQARFTGLLVVAMPLGAAALAEIASPGFLAGVLSNPVSLLLLGVAVALQLGGFAAIRRLGRIDESAS